MVKEINNRAKTVKEVLSVQEPYKKNGHDRIKELILLRHKLSCEIMKLRDNIADKRHKERMKVLKSGRSHEMTVY